MKTEMTEIMQSCETWMSRLDDTVWQNRLIMFLLRAVWTIAKELIKRESV